MNTTEQLAREATRRVGRMIEHYGFEVWTRTSGTGEVEVGFRGMLIDNKAVLVALTVHVEEEVE